MSSDISISSGKGFRFIDGGVVHETDRQKITVQVIEVPNPKNGKTHHFDLVIKKLSKTPKQKWPDATETKVSFTSDEPKSLQKLLDFLKAQPDLAQYRSGTFNISRGQNSTLTSKEREFVEKILRTFDTPGKQELLVQAKQDVSNLYAAVKHAKHKRAAAEFNNLINNPGREYELHQWIKDNSWVFGVEYLQFLDTRRIGIHSESDFIVESLDGFADLIELKKSDVKLFSYDNSHACYYPSPDLSKVIAQAIKYLKVMEDQRLLLKEEDGLEVLKPRIKVVIGRSSNLNTLEKQTLRLLNDSLHGIEILTYDEISKRAERLINHFSEIK